MVVTLYVTAAELRARGNHAALRLWAGTDENSVVTCALSPDGQTITAWTNWATFTHWN